MGQTFFNENGVTITNTSFIVHGQTYAMSGVTAVKTFVHPPSRKGPIICCVVGLGITLIELIEGMIDLDVLFSLSIFGAGIVWWKKQKTDYSVLLTTATGEVNALTSPDVTWINRIADALNHAMINRG